MCFSEVWIINEEIIIKKKNTSTKHLDMEALEADKKP